MLRTVALSVLTVLGLVSIAAADPYLGESVIYKTDSTHSYLAVVTNVVDSDEAGIEILPHDTLWYANSITYTSEGTPILFLADVTRGTGNGQWMENSAAYVGSRVSSQGTPSFTLNGAAIQLDTAKDTELSVSVTVALPLSLVAGATGSIHLLCDATTTPTTEVQTLTRGNTGGLVMTDTSTLLIRQRVRAADYCKVTTTQDVGSPTFSIVRQLRQTLD